MREMQEFNHRVALAGQLLFKEESAGLAKSVRKVSAAKDRVDSAIRRVGGLSKALTVVGGFLALVDEAIDLAKELS